MASPNLGLVDPTVGADNNGWGQKLNTDLDTIDSKFGDKTAVSTTGGTTTLNQAQENVAAIVVSGALVSDATIEFLSGVGGVWIFDNATTGAFGVTAKVTGQTGIVVPQGTTTVIWSNGVDIFSVVPPVDLSTLATISGGAWAAEAVVADSATPAIGAAVSYRVRADGTTTVTAFDSVAAGYWRIVRWNGIRALTNSASLILLGGASRPNTAVGDISMFRSEGSGVWREEFAARADGTALIGSVSSAAAADIWAGTSTTKAVTPKAMQDALAEQTLTDGATVTVDFAAGINFKLDTIGGNRTLAFASIPSAIVGRSGYIRVKQDGTGSRTLDMASSTIVNANGVNIVLSTAASAVDIIAYTILSTTQVLMTIARGVA